MNPKIKVGDIINNSSNVANVKGKKHFVKVGDTVNIDLAPQSTPQVQQNAAKKWKRWRNFKILCFILSCIIFAFIVITIILLLTGSPVLSSVTGNADLVFGIISGLLLPVAIALFVSSCKLFSPGIKAKITKDYEEISPD